MKKIQKIRIYFYNILIVFFFTGILNAQEDLIAEANESFERYAFIDARDVYLEVAKNGFASADLFRKLGDSYYLNADFENAVIWYERLINKYKDEVDAEYLYRYAQCLKSIEAYDKSDKVMEKFDALNGEYDKRAAFFRSTRYYLELIEKQSGKFDLNTIDINTEFSEHSPSFDHKGNLVFSSSRGGGILYEWDKMPFLDLYKIEIGDEEKTDYSPKLLKGKVNTPVHESSSVFTKDGKTMYFTRNNYLNKKLGADGTGTTRLKIYKATLNNNVWSNITELPFNSNEYSIAHPSLSPDEKKLYFASDMPDTFGNSDLYEVDINDDGSFGKPVNLGSHINTEGKETFPFVSEKGNLYFSSDGHVGLGGLDVFMSKKTDSIFSNPYNVGRPINSPYDDLSFIIDTSNDKGYFASNRTDGEGNDDIYTFVQTEPLDTKCEQYIEGFVLDEDTKEVLPNAEVLLLDENLQEISRTIAAEDGSYILHVDCDKKVTLRGQHIQYIPNQISVQTTKNPNDKTTVDIELKRSESFIKKVKQGDNLADILDMQNIYFDLNKSKIRKDAEVELQKIIVLMQKYPKLKVEVRSHTDSRANDAYNMELSKKRALATKQYIVKKGKINENRVYKKGFGETMLVNRCENNIDCSDEEHEMNRRSEFIIINENNISKDEMASANK